MRSRARSSRSWSGWWRLRSLGATAALASALLLLPTFVSGLADWSPSPERRASPLTPGLVQFLRNTVPAGDVVFSDLESSYRIAASAPVYICNAPPGHVADTKRNRPYVRRAQWRRFNRTGELGIPKRCGAAWLVIDRSRFSDESELSVLYRDGRFIVFRVSTISRGPDDSRERTASTIARVKVLLVSFYFPPAGGGGVQRPLKLAQYLPALGIETHVLAPDDPQWIHRDDALRVPTQAWVHRARYLGPSGRKPAEELHGKQGLARMTTQARLFGRRALVPDENVPWNLTAIPAAIKLVRKHDIDVVITTSPPNSIHLVGAAVKRATGARWVADLRDSPIAHVHRRSESAAVRAKEKVDVGVAKLVARSADAIVCVADFIADEVRSLEPRGSVVTIPNGSDFDDFEGLDYTPGERLRLTHTGSFFGKRDPRPFLQAFHDSGVDATARFLGDFRSADREWAEQLDLGSRLELIPYAPRATSLALQRDSEALLLLIPDAGGRGKGVLSGKVFEYIAARRPILAARPPRRGRRRPDSRDRRRCRCAAGRRRRDP